MGILASQAEIGSGSRHWGRFCGGYGDIAPEKKLEIAYAKSCNLVHFGQKMVPNAVHNAFLTMEAPCPCVSPAFQQWERRYHALPLEMTPGGHTVVTQIITL